MLPQTNLCAPPPPPPLPAAASPPDVAGVKALITTGPFGGGGGGSFDDRPYAALGALNLTDIQATTSGGVYLSSLQITYGSTQVVLHGSPGADATAATNLTLFDGESVAHLFFKLCSRKKP